MSGRIAWQRFTGLRHSIRAVRPWLTWATSGLALALLVGWLASFAIAHQHSGRPGLDDRRIRVHGVSGRRRKTATFGRWAVAGLFGAAFLRVPARLRNITGGIRADRYSLADTGRGRIRPQIGRFTLYTAGDDFWMFQRYAYRIVMQGFWLEGGSATFWFQPFYRWIVGGLHLIFGDSSVGEVYWDGACVLPMALFSFHVAKVFGRFQLGIAAAALTLTVFTLGTTWVHWGVGYPRSARRG